MAARTVLDNKAVTVGATAVTVKSLMDQGAFHPDVVRLLVQNCSPDEEMGIAFGDGPPASIDVMGRIGPGLILPVPGTAAQLAKLYIIGAGTGHRVFVYQQM